MAVAGKLLHHIFEAAAAASPRASCVEEEEAPAAAETGPRIWTYGEVNCAANRLARRLQLHGAGSNRCIGLLLPRVSPRGRE